MNPSENKVTIGQLVELLAAALVVTKFTTAKDMFLVMLCCPS
jgi:hypothetical protein